VLLQARQRGWLARSRAMARRAAILRIQRAWRAVRMARESTARAREAVARAAVEAEERQADAAAAAAAAEAAALEEARRAAEAGAAAAAREEARRVTEAAQRAAMEAEAAKAAAARAVLLCNRAAAHLQLQAWPEAHADASAALAEDGACVKALLRRAKAADRMGRPAAEALRDVERALEIAPGAPGAAEQAVALRRAAALTRRRGGEIQKPEGAAACTVVAAGAKGKAAAAAHDCTATTAAELLHPTQRFAVSCGGDFDQGAAGPPDRSGGGLLFWRCGSTACGQADRGDGGGRRHCRSRAAGGSSCRAAADGSGSQPEHRVQG
jgi:tetratricopeptide (TPR) repeat protein